MSDKTSDVIVVGAGIIGCATAYYLAKKGVSVTILEADEVIGNGGSTRNGGGVRQSGRDPRELPLAMYAVKNLWPHALRGTWRRRRVLPGRQPPPWQDRAPP